MKLYKYLLGKDKKLDILAEWIFSLTKKQLSESPFIDMKLSEVDRMRICLNLYGFNLGHFTWFLTQRFGNEGKELANKLHLSFCSFLIKREPLLVDNIEELIINIEKQLSELSLKVNTPQRYVLIIKSYLLFKMMNYHNLVDDKTARMVKMDPNKVYPEMSFDNLSKYYLEDTFINLDKDKDLFLFEFSTFISLNTYNVVNSFIDELF